ncbi:MAG: Hsp20/alpha crystallin family protein [Planctomycetota bacterium]|jgi:HSP20 family protein
MTSQNIEVKRTPRTRSGEAARWSFRPAADVVETPEEVIIKLDCPGAEASDFDIQYDNGRLKVHGAVTLRQLEETSFLRHEYGIGHFDREFLISEPVIDPDSIKATFDHGVLTVRAEISEPAKVRRIQVKAAHE